MGDPRDADYAIELLSEINEKIRTRDDEDYIFK